MALLHLVHATCQIRDKGASIIMCSQVACTNLSQCHCFHRLTDIQEHLCSRHLLNLYVDLYLKENEGKTFLSLPLILALPRVWKNKKSLLRHASRMSIIIYNQDNYTRAHCQTALTNSKSETGRMTFTNPKSHMSFVHFTLDPGVPLKACVFNIFHIL